MAQLGHRPPDPDAYFGSASLLEGEQNIDLLHMGSEQDDCSPSKLLIIVFTLTPVPSPPDTLARDNPPGKGAATERHATEARRPEPLKPPDLPTDDLEKSGEASALDDSSMPHGGGPGDLDSLGLAWTVADMEARKVEPSGVDAHERGGALPVVGAAPVLAEGTAGVEPAGKAEKATAAKPEALVPWAQGMAEREVEMLPGEGKHVHEPPPEVLPRKGKHETETPTTGEGERTAGRAHARGAGARGLAQT